MALPGDFQIIIAIFASKDCIKQLHRFLDHVVNQTRNNAVKSVVRNSGSAMSALSKIIAVLGTV